MTRLSHCFVLHLPSLYLLVFSSITAGPYWTPTSQESACKGTGGFRNVLRFPKSEALVST